MSIFGGFDADTVEPSKPRSLIPIGEYEAVIESVEEKENTNKNGSFLHFIFSIIGGEYDNQKLSERLNTKHPSADTVRIANAAMSAILRAVGVPRPVSEDEIYNIPFLITVSHFTDKSGHPVYNGKVSSRPTGYRPKEAPPARVQPLAKAEATSKSAPWTKK